MATIKFPNGGTMNKSDIEALCNEITPPNALSGSENWIKELADGGRLIADQDGDKIIMRAGADINKRSNGNPVFTDSVYVFINPKSGSVAILTQGGQLIPQTIGKFKYSKKGCFFYSAPRFKTQIFEIADHPDFPIGEKE